MTCNRCGKNRSRYSVVRPPCLGHGSVKLCQVCFSQAVKKGRIVWIGSRPFGVCTECMVAA